MLTRGQMFVSDHGKQLVNGRWYWLTAVEKVSDDGQVLERITIRTGIECAEKRGGPAYRMRRDRERIRAKGWNVPECLRPAVGYPSMVGE